MELVRPLRKPITSGSSKIENLSKYSMSRKIVMMVN